MQFITAGESHGPCLTAIVSGVPAGLTISEDHINSDLARRQSGYGRGGRQAIETDTAKVLSGVRFGQTLGTPIALQVTNRDWENWTDRMASFGEAPAGLRREVTPRPGHADLVGIALTDRHGKSSAHHIPQYVVENDVRLKGLIGLQPRQRFKGGDDPAPRAAGAGNRPAGLDAEDAAEALGHRASSIPSRSLRSASLRRF